MNKENIKIELYNHSDLSEIKNNHLDLKNIESSSYVTRLGFYVDRLLDILEKTEKKGNIQIDDEKLIGILMGEIGPKSATSLEGAIKAAEDYDKRLSDAISETVNPMKESVDNVSKWTEIGGVVQILDFIIVGLGVGLLSLFLPHMWDKEASKEPTKIIIEQPVIINQSKENSPEVFTEEITGEIRL